MEKTRAIELAVKKAVDIFKDNGIKVRPNEFVRHLSCKNNLVKTVFVEVYFEDLGERGKLMKREKNRFLNYFNIRVFDNKLSFDFSVKELEIEDVSNDTEDVSQDKIENVMKKIEKLLALAESDNENESISASLMAQKLLKKYNLEIEQITGKEKQEEVTECRADVKSGNKWKYELANVVAVNYCCKCFYVGSEGIVFYGYKSDALIARRMFVYLFEVGCRLARAYERKEKAERKEAYNNGNTWDTSTAGVYNSYCVGFTDGVREQLGKQCTALMLVIPQEVKDKYTIISKDFGTINTSIDLNNAYAYDEGREEGKRALNSRYISNDNQ